MNNELTEISRYSPISRWLHGINAVLVLIIVIPAGVWIHFFEPNDETFKMKLYNIHESFGLTIFAITLVRLVWRWLNPPPNWPSNTPRWIRIASVFTHSCLYLLLIFMPITGFLATNAWGFPLILFDWIPIPSPIVKDEVLAKALSFFHWCGALIMSGLICTHIIGFTYHRLIARDALSRRMM